MICKLLKTRSQKPEVRSQKSCLLLLASCFLFLASCLLFLTSSAFAAISTVDSQGGAYSSVKLQATSGYPAIASFDHKTGELRYVYWTGTQWIRGVVEEKGVTGYVSLALDSGNKPYISYYHNISKNNSTGSEISGKYGNHMVGTLKYAYCATTTCLTPEDWTKVTVAQIDSAVTSNGYTGGYTSLVFDSSGNPRIAYYDFSHKIDANDIKKGALKLAYCDSNCSSSTSWTIRTIDTDGGRSASMVIYSNKVMLSYDADEVQKIRYAEASSPFSSWTKADIDAIVNTGNLFRDTSIAINSSGKPRMVYQYQTQADYGHSTTVGWPDQDQPGWKQRRDLYYTYCDAANCTVSTNWTKVALAAANTYFYGYTSSIKLDSNGNPRIAYHYWGHTIAGGTYAAGASPAQDLYEIICTTSTCSAYTNNLRDSTENTGLYSSMVLDSSNNPFISYYNFESNQLKLYHPSNSYTDAGITADTRASDTSNGGTGLQSGDSFKILFSGATNGSACSITTANIDSILKLSNGHSWKCDGSTITAVWSSTNVTSPAVDTLTITVSSGTGGCVPTVAIGDRVSLAGSCIKTAGGSDIILQTVINGNYDIKPPNGAGAYYKMDEGAKFTAYDSAGSNHASLNNGVTWTTSFSGSGLSFDGSNDYAIVPGDPVDLDINKGKITIEAWLKPNNLFSSSYTVLGKESSYVMASNGQCAIATTGTAWAWYGGASMSRLQRDISGNKDIFRQVVCTYDSSTGLQKVYIDGIFDGSRTASGNVSPSNSPFAMGRRELSTWPSGRGYLSGYGPGGYDGENYWGMYYYNGKMDEVVIYNTALTESQIIDRFKELPAQIERADASDTSLGAYGLQSGDTIAIRFTNETNAPTTITKNNINTVLKLPTGKSWLDGNNAIGSAVWKQNPTDFPPSRFPYDTLLITLSKATSAPTVATGQMITLDGVTIKDKSGNYSITGSTTIRGSYDLNGAVAYWKFDESSGNPSDSVGQYNTGTLVNTPTYATGKFGNALTFTGGTGTDADYVYISNYPDLNPSNISVEAWMKSGAANWNTTGGVGKGSAYVLYPVTSTKNMRFYIYAGSTWQSVLFTADSSFDITQWHHYVGTWDGTNLKIYVDGVFKNTAAPTGSINTSDLNNLNIGVWDSYLNGSIDEVVIYNRAITADEVRKRSSAKLKYAIAKDAQGTPQTGIQTGDKVIITFDAPTAGTSITSTNIPTALALSSSHTWGTIQSAVWSTSTGGYTNDTLTITLSTTGSPTVAVGDTISLSNGTIKDTFNRAITGSLVIGGSFGVNLPAIPVAYYNFDEQSGTISYDSIGNNYGTLNNSFWKTERIFKGLYFDGSRYVDVPDSVDFDLSSYTIDAWVKVPDGLTTGVRRIISQDDGTNYWKLQLNNNKLELCDSILSTTQCWNTTATINDGEWHYVAGVRDNSNNQVLLYIDGVAETFTVTGSVTAHNIAGNIQIGRKSTGTEYFYGIIDEIAVYNTALINTEIQTRYRAPLKFAITSDTYFVSGKQAGDKVIIRFHGKTNGSTTPIDAGNINTILQLSSGSWLDGAGQIGGAEWSPYKFTNDTLTITLSATTSAPTIASGVTITVNGTYIKDIFGNAINSSITLGGDFAINLPEGAVSYWTLDSTNNDTLKQNNIVTNTGTAGACKFSNCYTYGASQYASVTNSYTLNPERITVEAWVNPGTSATAWATGNAYFFYGANSVQFYGVAGAATVRFYVNVSGTWRTLDYLPSSISGWHHYVGTYDGTNLKIYVDGVLQATSPAYTGVINQFDTGTFYFAQPATANTPSISIDDAAIYNRALIAEEVMGRYGDYTCTAIARDASNGGAGIQAGDTVKISLSGPTNAAGISTSNIETALALSNTHYWKNGSGLLGTPSPAWSSSSGGYSNDTLTITLADVESGNPSVAPQDTITVGSPIGSKYRAFTKACKIGGLFGDSLPTGKIAYWTFNEQSGTTAYDSIGNNYGTLNNSFWKTERIFKGLYFDGSRYVQVPDSSDFDLSSYTIDSWVKVPDGLTTGWRQIISQDDGTNYWRMRLEDNKLVLCDSRLTPACSYSVAAINDGEWHHVAVVRDGVANQVILYIDGVADNTVSTTGGVTAHNIATTVQIGRKYSGTEYFYGMIDEIAVYNSALTLTEVQTRYRAPIKSAFTSDPYFESGIQQAKDKVVIRFHGKTNGSTINPPISSGNIDTILQLSGGKSWGTVQSAAWSTYKFTDDTLTVTLGTGATIAGRETITVNGTYIKDIFNNAISDSFVLSKDFDFNLPEGAVSYWKLDEGSGTTASDRFGQNDIVSFTGAWQTTGCMFSNCLNFSTTNKYAQVNNSFYLNPERISVEAWVYTATGTTTWGAAASYFFYGASSAQLYGVASAATVRFYVNVSGTWRTLDYTPTSISGWHHYAGTYDGTNLKIYVDGALKATSATYTGVINQFDTGSFYLGAATNGSAYYIDDVAVYGRALTLEEVLGRYGQYTTITAFAKDTSNNLDTQQLLGIGGSSSDRAAYPEVFQLSDGKYRLYYQYSNGTYWQLAYKDTTDTNPPNSSNLGTQQLLNTGSSATDWAVAPEVIQLSGGYRLYYQYNNGTYSQLAYKDTTDTNPPNSSNLGTQQLLNTGSSATDQAGTLEVIQLSGGGYRLYYQYYNGTYGQLAYKDTTDTNPPNSSNLGTQQLLNTGTSSTDQTGGPEVIQLSDGKYRLYYHYYNGTYWQLAYKDTTDTNPPNGTNLGPQRLLNTGSGTYDRAGSSEVIQLPNSQYRIYYWWDDSNGTKYQLAFKDTNNSSPPAAVGGIGIQQGDTVTIKFPGPTNGAAITATNIDNFLTVSLRTWKNGNDAIVSAIWGKRVYENDTLTITLSSVVNSLPDIKPQDTISMGGAGEINAKYRAATYSAKISGTFGEPLPGTPVAFWKMDENIGTIAFDSVGTNDGTLTNSPTWTNPAMFNSGLNFSGSTSYMNVGSITLSGDWSVEGWFNYPLPATTTYNSLTGDRRVVVQRSSMKLGTYNGTAFVDLDTPYLMSNLLTGWHHIAAAGDSATTTTKFYIDGVLVGTASYKSTAALTTIGNITAGSEQFGLIDEVAVYNSVLTADDVGSRYLVFLKNIYAKDTSRGGAGIQNGDQVIIRFDGATVGTPIGNTNIATALVLSAGSWGTITSADWSTVDKTKDTLTITLQTSATLAVRGAITLGGNIIKDAYSKDITGSMTIGGDFGTNLPDGAVAYWRFDDGTSGSTPTTASDSFNDYNGTLTNTPTWTTAGRFNNALQFTGGLTTDADYVVVNNATALNPSRITVEAWAKSGAAAWNTNGTIVSKRDAYILYPVSGGKNMQFWVYAGGAWRTVTFTADASFDVTQWHHYAGTYDGTNLKIYVDGVLKNTAAYSGTISTTDTGNLFIGMDDGTTNYLNGNIDEVVLYNKALDAADIRTRYGAWFMSATAADASNKGPNIQATDTVVIRFTGETNGPTIDETNINTILAVAGKTWLGGGGNLGTPAPAWSTTAYTKDTLTITLSGPATYLDTIPAKPTVVVGDTITINGTIKDSSDRVIKDTVAISGTFGVASTVIPSSATANDASGKGPNIQANDTVVITFSGATNTPEITPANINTILPVTGKTWLAGDGLVTATWNSTTQLTITLSGPATYTGTTPTKPTIVVGDTITINGTITEPDASGGKAIISTVAISGSFGVPSIIATPSSAAANDASGKGPNIQANDTVVITFAGATNTPEITSTNINTILPVTGSTTTTVDTFDTTESWTESSGTGSVVSGVYNFAITATANPYFYQNITDFDESYDYLEFIYQGYGSSGPSSLRVYYTDGVDCTTYSETCAQSFDLIQDSSQHTLLVRVTDAEWVDNDGIIGQLRFDLDGAVATGTFKVDSIKFRLGKTWLAGDGLVTATWNSTTQLTITLSGPATYTATTPTKPTVVVGDTIVIDGTIADSSNKAIVSSVAISNSFGVSSTATPSSAAANDASGKGPNIQANDTVVITFAGATNTPEITPANINTILPVTGKTWIAGDGLVTATWNSTTQLTITLSGPATYTATTPAKPTVVVGDTITINGTITEPDASGGKAIVSTVAISNSFGVASTVTPSSAAANDASGKGPNIQANDTVVITFSGATCGCGIVSGVSTTIDASNINTVLPVSGKTWLDGSATPTIVSASWNTPTNTILTITLSGSGNYVNPDPLKPTVVVGDTITINGTITDSSGKAIVSSVAISNSFGVASTVTPSSAAANDASGKGPNIQANDTVVITFSGATNIPEITSTNINTILPVAGSTTTTVDTFDTTESWTESSGTGSVVSGVYNFAITATADPYFYKNITDFDESYDYLEFIYQGYGSSGPSSLKVYYTDGVDCTTYSGTCAQSFDLIQDSSQHTLLVRVTDAEWVDNDGIIGQLRFDLDGAVATGTFKVDSIKFRLGKTWRDGNNAIVSADWTTNATLTITLSGPATYLATTPAKPTVVVGDTIVIDGTITDSSNKAIVSTVAISGSFGIASTVTSSSAVADDNSNWGPNIQANDRVVITFSGATSAPVIDATNINTILPVTGKTWLDGDTSGDGIGNIGSAVWNLPTNTTLTITLSGPATQPETTPAKPTVVVGDTVIIDGTITDSTGKLIVSSNRAITGSFGTVSGTVISSAIASDDNGKYGQTTGDKVIIKFSGQIGYAGDAPPTINAGNINTVLAVSGKTWLDGIGALGGTGVGEWTSEPNQNDTLTITLSSATLPAPTIAVGDTITLGGSTIKDKYRTTISSSKAITGDFAIPSGMKAWWKFDSTSGTTVTDSYGSYGGTLTNSGGSATTWTSGRFSNGLYLDGTTATGDYVTLTTAYALTSNWTIEGWFKWPVSQVITSQQAHALVSSNASENQIVIYNQTKQLGTLSGATNYWIPNYTLTNLTNGWHYVAAVGTGGSGTAGTTTFYIDGVSVGSISYKSVANIKYLGNTSGLNRPMTNAIDNIVVYDTAISATAIKNRYGAWARSAYAYGTAGDYTGITTGDQVIIRFDQSTEGNSITSSNIGTALVLSSSHIWGSSSTASWSTTIYSNDTLTITLSTGGTTPTIAKGDTITLSNNVIKDYAGRPISDPVTLQGSFDFKLPLGAIAYWRFNEGTGTTVNDSFGSNNGTASQTYLWADGMYGTKGVTIDASNEAVALTSALNMPNEWTIMGWLKTPLVTGTNNALIHGTDHEHAININTQGANHELGNLSIPSEGNNFRGTGYYVNKQLKDGWHHVTAVGTGGSGTAGTTKYYINGQYVGEAVYSVNGSKYKAYTDIASIGNNTGAGAHAIGTTIDEISVYDRPLSETEIKQHYGARLKYAHANDVSGGDFGIDAGDQIVIGFDGETNGPSITASNIDTVLKLSNGHTWKDGDTSGDGIGNIGSAIWSTSTGGYTKDTLTITLSTGLLPPTITTRDTITLDGVTIKDLNRVITGSIDISGDFDGVAAYYDLDEASAVTAADSVNGNNGTLSGSTLPTWVSGYSGAALDFNDTNTQYVTIPDSNSFNMTDYTIEAWLKLPKTISSNYMRIVSQESSTQPINYWSLAINPSGQLVHCDSLSSLTTIPQATYNMGGLPAGQDPKCETVTTKDLRDEKWHFVAVVRDTNANQFKFFIDHILEKTVASSAGSGTHTIAGTVEIGRKNGYTGCSNPDPCSQEYFRGVIDNVAIYNYALTDSEVNAHHFLQPSEAHASDTSGLGSGVNIGDTVTILFNGETGATAINDLTTLNNALKLPTGNTWGTTFGSAGWSTTYYTNDTLKVTFGTGANMAVGVTITLGNVINDVHGNPISGSVAITGSFAINSLLGTIAYWKFDEGINDTIGDSVGSYSGTRYSGLGTWITGKFGSALDFTGTTGYVSLTNTVPLSSDEWTIEAWFYALLPTNGDNTNTLLIDTTTQHIVVMPVSGTSYLGVYSTADGGGFRSSGYNVANLTTGWHHLVAVGKNSKTYFYIDGSAVGTYSNYKPSASISKLGNGRNASSEFKRPWGKIDDMVIYKRALTATEISTRAAR